MRKILILAMMLFASPAVAQTVILPAARTAGGTPVLATPTVCLKADGTECPTSSGAATVVNGADVAEGSTSDAAYTDATGAAAGTLVAINKGLFVSMKATGTGAQQVQGNVAHDGVDAGNPLKFGGRATGTSQSVVAAGDRVDASYSLLGAAVVTFGQRAASADGVANSQGFSTFATDGVAAQLEIRPFLFNGTDYSRQRGDTTGLWIGGHGTVTTGQVAVTTSATLIAAARAGRQKIGVTVVGAVQCAFGASGVTLSTGWPLAAVAYASDNWDTGAAIYAVCASNTTVAYREQY